VQAEHIGSNVYLIVKQRYDRIVECWAFEAGDRVSCDSLETAEGRILAAVGSSASDADRIQALGAGTAELGTTVAQAGGQVDQAFWAGRVSTGDPNETRLMAVTSYVGNGGASRNITLNLSGSSPVFAIVVPTNATAKAYRVSGDTTGRVTASGNALANSITALGTDQITVGTALNANGVTYDVWAIRTGTVTP